MSQTPQQSNNENEKVVEFRLSWGLIIAFILAVIGVASGALIGHYVGVTLESAQATASANEMLSAEALQSFNFTQVGHVMYDLAMQDFNNALTMPSLFTQIGAVLGGALGFWFGLHIEENREKKKVIFK